MTFYTENLLGNFKLKAETTQINIVLQNDKFFNPSLPEFIGHPRVGDMSSYSLRNSDQYQTIGTKS